MKLQLRLRPLRLHHRIRHNPPLNLTRRSLGHIVREINLYRADRQGNTSVNQPIQFIQ